MEPIRNILAIVDSLSALDRGSSELQARLTSGGTSACSSVSLSQWLYSKTWVFDAAGVAR